VYRALSPWASSSPATITSARSSSPSEAATDAVVNVVSPGKVGTIDGIEGVEERVIGGHEHSAPLSSA